MVRFMKNILLLTLFLSLTPISCNGGEVEDKNTHYQKISDVPDHIWAKLSGKTIYFGHQSVGYNILGGVETILNENPQIKLSIKETYDPDDFTQGTIAHSRIGYNTDPESKLDMFAFIIKSGGATKADIMFLKFCYVDINAKTDVKALFNDYKKTFRQLKTNFPSTVFIHMTTPLTTLQDGTKAWIKKIMGRPLGGTIENRNRHEYNEMIRKTYIGQEPVFDIAYIESTFPNGNRATFELNGTTYYYLVPEYTNDGGHLNETGRKLVAEQLMLLLANIL